MLDKIEDSSESVTGESVTDSFSFWQVSVLCSLLNCGASVPCWLSASGTLSLHHICLSFHKAANSVSLGFIKASKWESAKWKITISCNLKEVFSPQCPGILLVRIKGWDYKIPLVLVGRDHQEACLEAPYHRYHIAFSCHIFLVSDSFSVYLLRRLRHHAIPEATSTSSIQISVSKCYSLIKEIKTSWRNGWF